jgi:branched-chain amino acid aminotransferase
MAIQAVKYLWLNGRLVPWQDAAAHPLTHALHDGSGVFEGMRCYDTERGTAVFRLTDHLRCLRGATRERPALVLRASAGLRGYGEMGLVPLKAPVDCLIAA